MTAIFENPRFAACVATNWWAANRGVEALAPEWESDREAVVDDASIDHDLRRALDGDGGRQFISEGGLAAAFGTSGAYSTTYNAGFAPHAAIEPLTATARVADDRLEVWAPTQAPGLMRTAVAEAIGYGENQVIIYPMLLGGAFGRKIENDAAVQVAIIARCMNRPVQLTWSREEETRSDYFRPAARAQLAGKFAPDNSIAAWHSRIAVPSTNNQMLRRIMPGVVFGDVSDPDAGAVEGGIVFGMSQALGRVIGYADDEPTACNFTDLDLPILADIPEIEIELTDSNEEPGGVGEIAVPPVAPAIGNAIFAATGQRLRSIPFVISGFA